MKIVYPEQSLLQGKPWTHSGDTKVQETWKRFGWQPPEPRKQQANQGKGESK